MYMYIYSIYINNLDSHIKTAIFKCCMTIHTPQHSCRTVTLQRKKLLTVQSVNKIFFRRGTVLQLTSTQRHERETMGFDTLHDFLRNSIKLTSTGTA